MDEVQMMSAPSLYPKGVARTPVRYLHSSSVCDSCLLKYYPINQRFLDGYLVSIKMNYDVRGERFIMRTGNRFFFNMVGRGLDHSRKRFSVGVVWHFFGANYATGLVAPIRTSRGIKRVKGKPSCKIRCACQQQHIQMFNLCIHECLGCSMPNQGLVFEPVG